MSGTQVRQQFTREFRNFDRYSRRKACLVLGAYVGQIVLASAAGYWVLHHAQGPALWITLALIIVFLGTRYRGINNIIHECSHFAYASERKDNEFFGALSCALLLKSFEAYRREHLSHHLHLGDYEKDLDFQTIRDFRLEEPLTARTIVRHVLTPLFGLHLPYYLRVDLGVRDGFGFSVLKNTLIAAVIIFMLTDPLAALLLVVVPFGWIYSAINYWTDCIDHAGLLEADDELHASRNLIIPKSIRLFFFPRNDCYHLIHHLFPNIPVAHFDLCHRRLMQNPHYRKRAGVSLGAATEAEARTPLGA